MSQWFLFCTIATVDLPDSLKRELKRENTRILSLSKVITFMKSDFLLCSQVFVDQLTSKDMEFIGDSIFSSIDKEIIAKMVEFSNRVSFSFFNLV